MLAVLQFDSANVALVDRMLVEGRLETLAGLRGRGVWHELDTPATHFAAGAFHTLYSGVELADHGLFYPFQWSAADQRARYMSAFEAPPGIWERLAHSGATTLAIDPYESRPPRHPRGTFVCGWQLKDRVVLQRWSRPAGVGRDLERLYGAPRAGEEVFGRPRAGELLRLRRDLVAAPRRVAEAATLLLGRERFDLAWLTFVAAHIAGHQFWDLSQVDESSLDRDARNVLEGALRDVYEAVDKAFGVVLRALPANADVIVVSPVGMDANTSRADMLPEMLEAVLRGGARPAEGPGWIWRLRAAGPSGLRARVARALPERLALDLTARLELRGMEWGSTRAFAQPADNQGYIRLNLRGRERDGIVDAADAPALLDEIAEGLATFTDPDGEPAVKSVERVSEVFGPGAGIDRLPDLVVRWSERPATRIDRVSSPRFGDVLRRGGASGRAGNHTEGGAWALVAPGRSSSSDPGRPPRLVDVAATVATVCGANTEGLPGESLLEPPVA